MSKPNVHGLPQHLRRDDGGYFLDYFVQEGGIKETKKGAVGTNTFATGKEGFGPTHASHR